MKPIYVTKTPNLYRIQFEYHPKLVEVIKMIPSKPRYDGTDRAWLVSINDARYPAGRDANWYVRAFSQWAVQMRFCSIVKEREVTEDINYDIPPMKPFVGEHYMLLQPYEYQLEGVQYAIEHKRCFFGDQPGLGKTLQAICAVVKAHKEAPIYGESFPVLVICPAALKVNWQREFKKFAGINAIILDDRNRQSWQSFYECKKSDGSPLCEVFITNYESLNKFFVRSVNKESKFTMKSIAFDQRVSLFRSVIIDESHKCKSSKTQQGKFVEGICKGKRYVFALTGTPVVNNNTDLIQQLKILGRLEDFGGYSRYVERYCDGPKQASNVKELNWRLWNTCFFRREKSKVLTQLPDKTRQYLTVDITTTKEYKAAEADMVKYLKKYKNASDEQVQKSMNGAVMVQMQLLKQISARGKIKAVCEFVHDVIDGGEKLILFGYLKEVVAELKKEFPKAVTVTGSDNVNQKQYAVDSFQNNPDCKLIILNFKSGGTGLTLTAASRVAFIEFPWTFSDCEQAEDRAHRNGQKNNVNCYYFLGKDTIDKYMYDVIQTKKNIANGVTGTDDQVEENMVNLAMDLFRDKL